jgi:hypothetical protein
MISGMGMGVNIKNIKNNRRAKYEKNVKKSKRFFIG